MNKIHNIMTRSSLILMTTAFMMIMVGCTGKLFNSFSNEPSPYDPVPSDLTYKTIKEVKSMYRSSDEYTKIKGKNNIPLEGPQIAVKGRVITSDRYGNFFNSFYIQDETGGIQVSVSYSSIYGLYPEGSEVVILLNGLKLGAYGGNISIGIDTNKTNKRGTRTYENSQIPFDLMAKHIFRQGDQVKKVEPMVLRIDQLRKSYEGQLVRIENVRFKESELNQSWGMPGVTSPLPFTDRHVIDDKGNELIIHTSNYAAFAGSRLPQGQGSITGILTYFRDDAQLLISSTDDAQMK